MTHPVRVTIVCSHALPGGSERYVEMLAAGLGAEFETSVVALQDGWLVERLRAAGQPVRVLPAGRRAGVAVAAVRLRRALRALDPDVVHANGVKAAFVAGLALRGTGIPVLWLKHDFAWDGPLSRVTAELTDTVVGVSAAVVEVLGPRPRVFVVPNGLPPAEFDAERGRARLAALTGAPLDAPVILLLGRLNRVKGALQLVDALPAVLARRPDAVAALIGGDDPGEPRFGDEVRQRVAALGLDRVVTIAPFEDRPLDLAAGAAVVAVPSGPNGPGLLGEGFGLVALEAMAVGTPVVAFRAGALPEVVGDCGLLVAPGDVAGLADALVRAIDDPELRARLAVAGPARVAESFTVERMLEALRVRYRALAG